MGTRGSHFQKVKEAPTAGGASHFVRDMGLVVCLVLCSSTLLHSFAFLLVCCLSFLSCATSGQSRWQYLARTELSAVDMLNKCVQTRCNCVRRAWHVVGIPCTSVWQMMCLCQCGG